MNSFELGAAIREWDRDPDDEYSYSAVREQIDFLARTDFYAYEPTRYDAPFHERLAAWIDNCPDEQDRRRLFRFVPSIYFISAEEFVTLYQLALQGPVTRWLIDLLGLGLSAAALGGELQRAMRETWFCPVTDSMAIASFCHCNNLSGNASYRPDWRSLAKLANRRHIIDYMDRNALHQLVLLEDFVGTGDQMRSALEMAEELGIPTLCCPLIAAPEATDSWREAKYQFVQYEPVVTLGPHARLPASSIGSEPAELAELRDLVIRTAPLVMGNGIEIDMFGYKATGALAVLYTNCPDNTIPLVHHRSSTWSPLFPRSTR